jgi:alpha-L-arabinofuranosidase
MHRFSAVFLAIVPALFAQAPAARIKIDKSRDISTRVENQEGTLARNVEVWQLNHADLKATHTFGDDKKVVPTTREFAASVERNGFVYTFPAHSLTILKLHVE